jgi:hypothetical protein
LHYGGTQRSFFRFSLKGNRRESPLIYSHPTLELPPTDHPADIKKLPNGEQNDIADPLGEVKSVLIHNLSKLVLSEDMYSLLNKGLSYIPTPKFISLNNILQQHATFIRKIKLKDYFNFYPYTIDKPKNSIAHSKFSGPSTWTPGLTQISAECIQIIKELDSNFNQIVGANHPQPSAREDEFFLKNFSKKNLTKGEWQALKVLKGNRDIVIKPADKGCGIVIMDLEQYKAEAFRQLLDKQYYTQLSQPLQAQTARIIKNHLIDLYNQGYISYKQFLFLNPPPFPRPRVFYLLPKIHKDRNTWTSNTMPPGRPIISNCASETSEIAKYIDSFLIPLANKHPTYVKNSYEFSDIVRNQPVEEADFLFTADISSLYTNMDNLLTLQAVKNQFLKYPDPSRPDKILLDLLNLILHSNDFKFEDYLFQQIKGCSMGLNCSPSLANIFLINFDEKAMNGFYIKPKLFFRYLDDIFGLFKGKRNELEEYENYLNSLIPGIKLTFDISPISVNFLDVTIFKYFSPSNVMTLQTKIYFKPTDSHQLLHTLSYHPSHVFNSILYSQLLRFKRITSFKDNFSLTCSFLFPFLKKRGYSKHTFKKLKRKVWYNQNKDDNKETDNIKEDTKSELDGEILPFVIDFCPIGHALSQAHRKTLSKFPLTVNCKVINSFNNQTNLAKILVRAKL